MKNITLASAILVLVMSAGSASAEPTVGNFGINVDLTNSTTPSGTPSMFLLKGKYVIKKDMAVLAGVGMQMSDSGAATNSKHTNIGFMGGIRKYLRADNPSPFAGGKLQYLSTRQGNNDVTDISLMAEAGAEYFLAKQFSIEGSFGVGYASQEINPVGAAASTKATRFGTTTFNASANFYF